MSLYLTHASLIHSYVKFMPHLYLYTALLYTSLLCHFIKYSCIYLLPQTESFSHQCAVTFLVVLPNVRITADGYMNYISLALTQVLLQHSNSTKPHRCCVDTAGCSNKMHLRSLLSVHQATSRDRSGNKTDQQVKWWKPGVHHGQRLNMVNSSTHK